MTNNDPQPPRTEPRPDDARVGVQATRGAKPGGRILVLLIVSIGLVALLLLGIWFLSQDDLSKTNANNGEQAVDAQAFDTNAGQIPAADAPTTDTGEPTSPPTGQAPNVNAPTTSAQ